MKYNWDSITGIDMGFVNSVNTRQIILSMETERRRWEMVGLTTKKDFFAIWRAFGLAKALRVMFTRSNVALNILMR